MDVLFKIVPGLLGYLKDGVGGALGWLHNAAEKNPKTALTGGVVGGSMFDPSYWQKTFEFIASLAKAIAPLVK